MKTPKGRISKSQVNQGIGKKDDAKTLAGDKPEVFLITSKILEQVVSELLGLIKERSAVILSERFGLSGFEPKTLDQIGKKFKITRERVRQIESDVFKKLHKIKKSVDFNLIIQRALEVIEESGGFCERSFLKTALKKDITNVERNQLMFILNASAELQYKKGTLMATGFWFFKKENFSREIPRAHNFVLKFTQSFGQPYYFEEILRHCLEDSNWRDFFSGEKGMRRLNMLLKMSKLIKQNILGEWGAKNWPQIVGRGSSDRAYLVLKKHKKPLHFKEIADHVNGHWPERKTIFQTVHNELIKDERFVLVGRGVYGLKEWGYTEGTVKELIYNFIKEKSRPQARKEIIEHILKIKKVKKETILVALSNKKFFTQDQGGLFGISA